MRKGGGRTHTPIRVVWELRGRAINYQVFDETFGESFE
jgi:hypothetical protein